MSVKILYFAWVRERIGKAEETVELPSAVATGGDLMGWLAGRATQDQRPAVPGRVAQDLAPQGQLGDPDAGDPHRGPAGAPRGARRHAPTLEHRFYIGK